MPSNWQLDKDELCETLLTKPFSPCEGAQMRSAGWVSVTSSDLLAHAVGHHYLLSLGVEQKLLPANVIRQYAEEKAKTIEEAEGRRIGKRELRELKEAMMLELLPRALAARDKTFGWIDPKGGWLVVDAASPARAEEFLEVLRECLSSLPVKLIKVALSPSAAMTSWMAEGEAPSGFSIDLDMEMRSAENAKVRYVKHSLEGEEIPKHISEGKVVTKLALTWQDKISFVLDENLQIKRLQFLDILKEENEHQTENADERFDLDFALMAGEISQLLPDLMDALGGETQ